MCGITAIVANKNTFSADSLSQANAIVSHRGPNDEGFLFWKPDNPFARYAGRDTAKPSVASHQLTTLPRGLSDWKVGFAHRRLSILDLSPAGHQPMIAENRFAITYNGEIFNYIEIKEELLSLGYAFATTTDTEVILRAWEAWGDKALQKFNGMFAFVLLDTQQQKLYAVRDRFGVKPLYYTTVDSYTAFASEVKQLRMLPDYRFELNQQIAYDYLRYSLLDHEEQTFEEHIFQVMPGHYLEVDITTGTQEKVCWYTLQPKPWKGTDEEAIAQFAALLKDSVRLRMRSDVPIGSALSGGLDSSTIVCLMKEIVSEQDSDQVLKTITSCSIDKLYDEWDYAEAIVDKVKAESFKVFPTFDKLQQDMGMLLWHMDYPFGSTSQFSQWCVFEEARKRGLPVMLNGQGADEQLAGYSGNDMSLYIGLLRQGKIGVLSKEIKAYKKYRGHWPFTYVIGAIQHRLPNAMMFLVPEKFRVFKNKAPVWLHNLGLKERHEWSNSLNESLKKQVTHDPLPSLLRYEDRNSMAFSIESRVPFMDYRLIEFTLGLPEHLVYRKGERKYILREAFKNIVPEKNSLRKDKMGFVSAEQRWLQQEGKSWFMYMVDQATLNHSIFIKQKEANDFLLKMQQGVTAFNFDPWRILCFSYWLQGMQQTKKY